MRVIILTILEIGCIYCLIDNLLVICTHKLGKSAYGTILAVKKVVSKDKGRWFLPKNTIKCYEVSCDYILDLEYIPEGEQSRVVKNLEVASEGLMAAGGLTSKYGENQTVAIKYLPALKNRVVFDLPEARLRPSAYVWSLAWLFCISVIGYAILDLMNLV